MSGVFFSDFFACFNEEIDLKSMSSHHKTNFVVKRSETRYFAVSFVNWEGKG